MRALAGQPSAPYQLGSRNAGSSAKIEVTSLDDDDQLVVPDSMRYRLDNLTVNQQILDWTTIAMPTSIQDIVIPATLNQIQRNWDDFELMQVTVEITSGQETQAQLFLYQLTNLTQGRFPSP